jgi:phage tail-like protein
MMARLGAGLRLDPLLGHNFLVGLQDSTGSPPSPTTPSRASELAIASFSECTGLGATLDTEDQREGGRNSAVLKFPTRTTWPPITLRRGVTVGSDLLDWLSGFTQGRGRRRDGTVILLDDRHEPSVVWCFQRGLPVRWTGPSLNAGRSEVAVESLEIVHEGLYRIGEVD